MTRARAGAGLSDSDRAAGRASPRLSIVLPLDVKQAAVRLARADGRSVSDYIARLIKAAAGMPLGEPPQS